MVLTLPFLGGDRVNHFERRTQRLREQYLKKIQTQKPEKKPGVDIEEYAVGGNWYEIPGVGKVQGKKKALEALKEVEADD